MKYILTQVLSSNAFKQAKRISIYLSLSNEINTQNILDEMFRQQKEVKIQINQMILNEIGFLINLNMICRCLFLRTVEVKWLC